MVKVSKKHIRDRIQSRSWVWIHNKIRIHLLICTNNWIQSQIVDKIKISNMIKKNNWWFKCRKMKIRTMIYKMIKHARARKESREHWANRSIATCTQAKATMSSAEEELMLIIKLQIFQSPRIMNNLKKSRSKKNYPQRFHLRTNRF
jgi:hypothetical protein